MDEQTVAQPIDRTGVMAEIVSAYLSNNHMQVADIPALISDVHAALTGLDTPSVAEPAGPEKPTAAQIKKSITPDALISFIDGKPYKTMKRHLAGHGLTIEDYRTRYGLPSDYPSVSPNYSAQRSALAKSLGLGKIGRNALPKAAAVAETISDKPKLRGRPRKA